MRDVIASLPDHATLGELVAATRGSATMGAVLQIFTVQELIDAVRKRPAPAVKPAAAAPAKNGAPRGAAPVQYDADGNPVMDLGDPSALVIRRRADVPDGDVRVLRCLAERGGLRESELATHVNLTGEQLRIIVRSLRAKGFVHLEGSGVKRRLKITRHGNGYLRKQ
ncbi:MAG: hypothetical protein K1X88_25970 [Nannocystaceae bacterium]|nr:hypothetical protein [Nannocystaceae bacterium]